MRARWAEAKVERSRSDSRVPRLRDWSVFVCIVNGRKGKGRKGFLRTEKPCAHGGGVFAYTAEGFDLELDAL
jgi:hypothetical protein